MNNAIRTAGQVSSFFFSFNIIRYVFFLLLYYLFTSMDTVTVDKLYDSFACSFNTFPIKIENISVLRHHFEGIPKICFQ